MKFVEAHGKLSEDSCDFDIKFWQDAGDLAIFEAAQQMISDYILLKKGHASQPRLQRSIVTFSKA